MNLPGGFGNLHFLPHAWNVRTKELMFRLGITGKKKKRYADERTAAELREEAERRRQRHKG